jgi:hypothetical protein
MTVYDSLHSLLDHERLLFHCDEWRTVNHCSHIQLSTEWRMKYLFFFITSKRPEYKSHFKRLIVLPLSR